MEAIETYTYKNYSIEIHYDSYPEHPREDREHCSVIFLIGGRHGRELNEVDDNLPRKHIWINDDRLSVDEPDETDKNDENDYWEEASITSPNDFHDWDQLEEAVKLLYPNCLFLSVFKYEHGSVCFNTTGFSCPWDSGQVGYIMLTNEAIQANWEGDRAAAESCLKAEVSEYSAWANGDVYRYVVYGPSENEDEPSTDDVSACSGYYDLDDCKKQAEADVDYEIVEAAKVAAGVTDDEEEQ